MTKLLKELEKSFPQLDDWTLIYPTATIKELVADVYKQVVLFARSVAVYFSQFHGKAPRFYYQILGISQDMIGLTTTG